MVQGAVQLLLDGPGEKSTSRMSPTCYNIPHYQIRDDVSLAENTKQSDVRKVDPRITAVTSST